MPRRDGPCLIVAFLLFVVSGCTSAAVPLPAPTAGAGWGNPLAAPRGPVDPADTGVPPGVVLEPSGGLRITEPGTVVDGLDVKGCIEVLADDVVIRNSRVRCSDRRLFRVVAVGKDVRRLVVESSELDGRGKVDIGVGWGDYTLRRVNIHGVVDGARFGYHVVVEDSWIHDLVRIDTLHPDALQATSGGDVVIRRNVLSPNRRDPSVEGGVDHNNASLMLGSEVGEQRLADVLVEGNQIGGGSYSINVRGDINADDIVIRDNVFVDDARYGPVIAPDRVPLSGGNVMASTGEPVTVQRAR